MLDFEYEILDIGFWKERALAIIAKARFSFNNLISTGRD
jgi:hypothetical protein